MCACGPVCVRAWICSKQDHVQARGVYYYSLVVCLCGRNAGSLHDRFTLLFFSFSSFGFVIEIITIIHSNSNISA